MDRLFKVLWMREENLAAKEQPVLIWRWILKRITAEMSHEPKAAKQVLMIPTPVSWLVNTLTFRSNKSLSLLLEKEDDLVETGQTVFTLRRMQAVRGI